MQDAMDEKNQGVKTHAITINASNTVLKKLIFTNPKVKQTSRLKYTVVEQNNMHAKNPSGSKRFCKYYTRPMN